MQVTIFDRGRSISLSVQSIQVDNSIDLHFDSTEESMGAFQKLQELNVRCYHAGKNAPAGPYIAFYPADNRDTKFHFNNQ